MQHYYQAPDHSLHALDDPAYVGLLPTGSVEITAQQYAAATAPTLAQVQASQVGQVAAAYQAAVTAPVQFTTAAKVTKAFQADAGSVANLQAALAGLSGVQATPPGFYWVAQDNTQVPFTYADLQGLAAAILAQGWAGFQRLQTAKSAIAAATTASAAQAVVF